VDLGYRGQHDSIAQIIHRGKKQSKRQSKRLRRRSTLGATIGRMKVDGLLDGCYLKGTFGDAIHGTLCGVGHNLRLMRSYWAEAAFSGVNSVMPVLDHANER